MKTFEIEVESNYREVWLIDALDRADAEENFFEGYRIVSEEYSTDVIKVTEGN